MSSMSATQAARVVGISEMSLSRWLRQGLVEGTFNGSQWEIPASEIARLRRQRCDSCGRTISLRREARMGETAV